MGFITYFRSLFRRAEFDDDMDEELRSHIALRADDLERSGLPRPEAERQARAEFGGPARFKEEIRDVAGGAFLYSVIQDARIGLRVLRKSPGFAIPAIATLALAIGANAVVFAALNAVLLRPVDIPHPETLYSIHRVTDSSGNFSVPDYIDFRERNRSFQDLAAYNFLLASLDSNGSPTRVWLIEASGNYFDALGVRPYLGRFFHASDEHGSNSAPYIVLTHYFWHTHFHDDRRVIGRTVQLDKHPYTVIGVAPPGYHGTLMFLKVDAFVPMVNQAELEGDNVLNARANRWVFQLEGHLKPGVTLAQAAADVNAIDADLEKSYPREHVHKPLALMWPNLYGDYLGGPIKAFLAALTVLAGLVLLAACANLGSLFAARAADRSREVALRLALGAERARVVRQLFTEAILISLIGGALGLWGSIVLLSWLTTWQPFPLYPITVPISPDWHVYLVALLLALVSGFLFGAVPVRQVVATDPYEIVKSRSRCTPGPRLRGRDLLLVVQIAICAVLVTSSFVAVRGLLRSLHSNIGFRPDNVMLMETDLNMAGYHGDAAPAMQKRMIEAMQTIPGVSSVAVGNWAPLVGGDVGEAIFTDDTADLSPARALAEAEAMRISPDFFQTAGTSLLAGRTFTWHDDKSAPRVAIVNQEFARRILGSVTGALGRYFKLRDGSRIQVVGIVENGKYATLTESLQPAIFLPLPQMPATDTWLFVRSTGTPQQLAPAIRGKMHDLDASLPLLLETWNQGMDISLFPSRVATVALGILGLMGAILSVTGIFGMAAYSVSKRLKELGIRIALGGGRREILHAALGRAVKLLAVGSAAGLLLGIFASRVLAAIVYSATPRDPLVLAGVVLAMALLGVLATWIPARRALSVDPLILLREE